MHRQAQTGTTDCIHAAPQVREVLDLLALIFCFALLASYCIFAVVWSFVDVPQGIAPSLPAHATLMHSQALLRSGRCIAEAGVCLHLAINNPRPSRRKCALDLSARHGVIASATTQVLELHIGQQSELGGSQTVTAMQVH